MEEIIERIKSLETPQAIIYSAMLGLVVFIAYGVFKPADTEEAGGATIEVLEFPDTDGLVKEYNSKLEAYELEEERSSSLELRFDESLFGADQVETTDSTTSLYDNEEDGQVRELQRQIELMEQRRTRSATNTAGDRGSGRTVTAPKREKEEPTYEQQLLRAKEEMLAKYGGNERDAKAEYVEPVAFTASFYNDQWVLPNGEDRARLILEEDVEFGGRTYPKGTFIFANISISKSRVFLDVTNIEGSRLEITAYDINDRNEGIYSKRAGELWRQYENEAMGDVGDEVARGYGRGIGGRAVENVARGLSRFLANKRLREEDKILLVDNAKVYFSNE